MKKRIGNSWNKRILAVVLATAILAACMPATALAEQENSMEAVPETGAEILQEEGAEITEQEERADVPEETAYETADETIDETADEAVEETTEDRDFPGSADYETAERLGDPIILNPVADPEPALQEGYGILTKGMGTGEYQWLYFGYRPGAFGSVSDGYIKWGVADTRYNSGFGALNGLILLSMNSFGQVKFQADESVDLLRRSEYDISTLKAHLDSLEYEGENAIVTAGEQSALNLRELRGGGPYYTTDDHIDYRIKGDDARARFWAPTITDVYDIIGKNMQGVICLGTLLSTPGIKKLYSDPFPPEACVVYVDVMWNTESQQYEWRIKSNCPADKAYPNHALCQLNFDKILFTSSAENGKLSQTTGPGALDAVGMNRTKEWKVTLLAEHDGFGVDPCRVRYSAQTMTAEIPFTGAKVEENGYISAIIKDADGKIKYYGRILEVTEPNGTATVALSGKMTDTDKLYIFNEQCNGDKLTDYASGLKEIPIVPGEDLDGLHALTHVDRVDPTPITEGKEEYWVCDECGKKFSDEEGLNEIREPAILPRTLEATPSALDFGAMTEGYVPETKTITLKNNGTKNITFTQPDAELFTIGSLSKMTIGPDETVGFTVTPKTLKPVGRYEEQLRISCSEGSGNYTTELNLKFRVIENNTVVTGYTRVASTHTGCNNNENEDKMIDGDRTTKFCGTLSKGANSVFQDNRKPVIYLDFRTEKPVIPKGYILTTGNDTKENPERNPLYWEIYASKVDGPPWTRLTKVTDGGNLPEENTTDCTFLLDNDDDRAYKYFHFEIWGHRQSREDLIQLSEIQLLGFEGRVVTFDANGGTLKEKSAFTGEGKKLDILPVPSHPQKNFAGWFTAKTGGEPVTTDTVFPVDTTIYAHWEDAANIAISPELLDFSYLTPGYETAPEAQMITVTNKGKSSIALAMPESEAYDIQTENNLTNVAPGSSVRFSVRPLTGLPAGEYNETLKISTTGRLTVDTVEADLCFRVGYFLSGNVEAGDLTDNATYVMTGNTILHVGEDADKTLRKITWEQGKTCSLMIIGEASGKLTVTDGISAPDPQEALNTVTICGGEVNLGSKLDPGGDVRIEGGNITSKTIRSRNGNITVTGGTISVQCKSLDRAMWAAGTIAITGGDSHLSTSGIGNFVANSAVKATDVVLGGEAVLYIAGKLEAVELDSYDGHSISIADSLNVITPEGGHVAETDTNAGHIVDDKGNRAKTVRIYPKVLFATPAKVDFGAASDTIPEERIVTVINRDAEAVELEPVVSEYFTIGAFSKTTLGSGQSATFTIVPDETKTAEPGQYRETLKLTTDRGDVYTNIEVSYLKGDAGDQIWVAKVDPYTYTGSEIRPVPEVYYHGKKLTASDYSIKYSGNVNVARDKNGEVIEGARITVTGKGDFSGKTTVTFGILPFSLGTGTRTPAAGISVGALSIVSSSKAVPVITYGSYKLGTRDYAVADANKKYLSDGEMLVTGKGNFTGSVLIPVHVVANKKDVKTFKVAADTKTPIVYDPARSEDDMRQLLASRIKVYDSADKKKEHPLDAGFMITYPSGLTDAGVKTVQVIGTGEYTGTVTQKLTVKPLAVKTVADGLITTNAADVKASDAYFFDPAGVSVGGNLTVSYTPNGAALPVSTLKEGRDYTIAYKDNKAASTDTKKATYTINFIGNYKGTPAIKNDKRNGVEDYMFTIRPVKIEKDQNMPADHVKVTLRDLAYNNKPDLYASTVYVEANGVLLGSKDCTVRYFKDRYYTEEITKRNKLEIPAYQDYADVYVVITGKGNYEGVIHRDYRVYRTNDQVLDISKARVTIYGPDYDPASTKNKKLTGVPYTGEPITLNTLNNNTQTTGRVVVEYKLDGNNYTELVPGTDFYLSYVNNTHKGKATLIIDGVNQLYTYEAGKSRKFVGTMKVQFSIGTKSIADLWDAFKNLIVP
ncbi:MAG: InlB B-repeat-containing protein [Lachnospiraceae bacterium]|nr:InlB B-repeat-containing protein [Lachnospiraceae bacterium]